MSSVPSSRITTTDDIKRLGTILSVWAHPDDESFSCAGIMAAAAQNRQQVICITATKGEAGIQDESRWPAERLGDIRAAELIEALNIIGVTDHHWLGYPDGGCADVALNEASKRLVKIIEKYKPDSILTFGPDGITGHPDHTSVSRWVSEAVSIIKGYKPAVYHAVEESNRYERYLKDADQKFNIYFNVESPLVKEAADCEIAFELNPQLCTLKRAALAAMPSQTEGMLEYFGGQKAFNTIFCVETFVESKKT